MSVLSREGMLQLVACSTKAKKYVVIYYHYDDEEERMRNIFVCVPIDDMIPSPNTPYQACIKTSQLELSCSEGKYLKFAMISICTEGKNQGRLYFFGGLDPPLGALPMQNEYVVKNVYRYDLHELPKKVRQVIPCNEMIYGMRKPFLAQVGDDCIYVLNRGKTQFSDKLKPAFQEFNFMKNEWVRLDEGGVLDNCDCNESIRRKLSLIPHVVIGHKLHISIGNSSFTFDTIKCAWENCKLFETFWSESGISPLNFYGMQVWWEVVVHERTKKKMKREEVGNYGGGPPFGFSGKWIIWDKNILLGVHFAKNCPLVAFLLDDVEDGGRVVRSQALDWLYLEHGRLHLDARLVNLGRKDGYFGLINFVYVEEGKNKVSYGVWNRGDLVHMELVIFRVWRSQKEDDDHFLEHEFVGREIVLRSCDDMYNAFSV